MGEREGHPREAGAVTHFYWRLCPTCSGVQVRMERVGGRLDGVALAGELPADSLVRLTAFLTMEVAKDEMMHALLVGEMKKLRDELKGGGRG